MVNIPVRFKRVAAAFFDIEAVRLCESSGSEHSAASESPDNLSDLVASFMEKDGRVGDDQELFNIDEEMEQEDDGNNEEAEVNRCWSDSETKDMLMDLLGSKEDDKAQSIRMEVEMVCQSIGSRDSSEEGFKRRLMSRLRERGLNAGLCKSRWEKSGHRPAGDYQYIDVNMKESRYIVEVNLRRHFEIARPTNRLNSLLELFPLVFVGRPEVLKRVVRLMCAAMKQSMKNTEMPMPPWRRNSYMQCKWSGSYKRTTNKVPTRKVSELSEDSAKKRSIGFVASPVGCYRCRDDFTSNAHMRIGQLTAAFRNN